MLMLRRHIELRRHLEAHQEQDQGAHVDAGQALQEVRFAQRRGGEWSAMAVELCEAGKLLDRSILKRGGARPTTASSRAQGRGDGRGNKTIISCCLSLQERRLLCACAIYF